MAKNTELLKQIDDVFQDERYKKNFRLFPDFCEIAKFLAEDYGVETIPEILKHTRIRTFGRSTNTHSLAENEDGVITTTALGTSHSIINKKTNTPYKARSIQMNQNFADRENYDFDDFASLLGVFDERIFSEDMPDDVEGERRCSFDRLRREDITSGDKILEQKLFYFFLKDELKKYKKEHKEIAKMSYRQQVKKFYKPKVRLKDEKLREALCGFFEGKTLDENTEKTNDDLFDKRSTLCHEFLHSITKRRGTCWGGVSNGSKYYLHEGMTEWLTLKTMKKHKEFFSPNGEEIKPFDAYEGFVSYVEMIESVFPGATEDVYFNGQQSIEKYKHKNISLRQMIDDFFFF